MVPLGDLNIASTCRFLDSTQNTPTYRSYNYYHLSLSWKFVMPIFLGSSPFVISFGGIVSWKFENTLKHDLKVC